MAHLTRASLHTIVSAAARAPSADNCQPFRFVWDGRALALHHVEERASHALNRRNHASLLTLGAMLESMAIAASTVGLAAAPRLADGLGRGGGPWASVRFAPDDGPADQLFPWLERRVVDRRPYVAGARPDAAFLARLRDETARDADARVVLAAPEHEAALIRHLAAHEPFLFWHRPVHRDLYRWLRFGKLGEHGDGMPWQTLGLPLPLVATLWLCRRYRVQRLLNRVGFPFLVRRTAAALLRSATVLGGVTIRDGSPAAMVDAGRLYLRVWLRLNSLGYGFQPVSLASLGALEERLGAVASETPAWFRDLLAAGDQVFRRCLPLTAADAGVWLFRAGPARPAPLARSPRLPLGELLDERAGFLYPAGEGEGHDASRIPAADATGASRRRVLR